MKCLSSLMTLAWAAGLLACSGAPITSEPTLTLPAAAVTAELPPQAATATSPGPTVFATRIPTASALDTPGAPATSARSGSPSTPLTIQFVIAHPPRLGEPVAITVTLRAARDAPNTTARLELPNSAVLVSGQPGFAGDLKRDTPVQFASVIKFTSVGNWTLRATAKRTVSTDEIWADAGYIYLHIGAESSHYGFEGIGLPPTPSSPIAPPPAITAAPPK